MSFSRLDTLCGSLEALDHALAILGADEATHMATGGGAKRAEAMAVLQGMYHRQATAPEIGDWLEAAKSETLNEAQRAALREFEREYRNRTCLPVEFVERAAGTRMRCEQLWRDLRPRGDWTTFEPALAQVLALAREEAAMRADILGLDPYDALLEQYDPGTRSAQVDVLFDALRVFLAEFLPRALAAQERRRARHAPRPFSGPYPVERQRELGLALMVAVGFDLTRGSLAVSHHPFSGGVPSDVRLTTRYRTDGFLHSLMGILHETGHGLYEQNLPEEWSHWPLGRARGMAMHESQSLFVEKELGRSPAFWQFALPLLETHLGERWTPEDILGHVQRVEPGFIRVDADEVTYPLHVILRYELERELIGGRLEAADLPEAWDAKMRQYLGLSTIDNPADGPMQDVHWAGGDFGYFPSYTLGALMAAQQWTAIGRDHPDVEAEIAAGNFTTVNAWRREHIWRQASLYSAADILERATGEPLNPAHFMDYLRARYDE